MLRLLRAAAAAGGAPEPAAEQLCAARGLCVAASSLLQQQLGEWRGAGGQRAAALHTTAAAAGPQPPPPLQLQLQRTCGCWGGSSCVAHQQQRLLGRQHGWPAANLWPPPQQQQARWFAKGRPAPPKPAVLAAAKAAAAEEDPYAPPEFRVRRVPRVDKRGALSRMTPQQRALAQQLVPGGAPLRSLRQLGWPLGQKQVLALMHEQLSDAAGTNVAVVPFVLGGLYQSAAGLAAVVRDYIEAGRGVPQVEQFLLTTIASIPAPEVPFDGIKLQVKGRLSGKSGMTSRRTWSWGRPSASNLADPVDYAHEAVVSRAGYIGIKVWIRYKRSVMEDQAQRSTRSAFTAQQLLAMPAVDALPSRSSSAWWARPGPLQPAQHRVAEAFKPGYSPLKGTWAPEPEPPLPPGHWQRPAGAGK